MSTSSDPTAQGLQTSQQLSDQLLCLERKQNSTCSFNMQLLIRQYEKFSSSYAWIYLQTTFWSGGESRLSHLVQTVPL